MGLVLHTFVLKEHSCTNIRLSACFGNSGTYDLASHFSVSARKDSNQVFVSQILISHSLLCITNEILWYILACLILTYFTFDTISFLFIFAYVCKILLFWVFALLFLIVVVIILTTCLMQLYFFRVKGKFLPFKVIATPYIFSNLLMYHYTFWYYLKYVFKIKA